ncbi:MAG: hydroxymethylglutaryl-CoA reductase [bacterium]|nr:hydroxymethylglutaryl-CoA reductase [bacterium]
MKKIPRNKENDYSNEAIKSRQDFIKEESNVDIQHINKYSFDPGILPGNIEHFTGVAQVPIGLAGPLLVKGEHANGEFYIPLATTEGTLVASYNRGMKLLFESGGITTTVSDDAMQRAPVFVFHSAREARDFGLWIKEHFETIKAEAEKTTRSGKLRDIEQYQVSKMMFLRFNFTTGDAAGQNMVGKATYFACKWINENNSTILRHALSGNIDTDKKHSHMNTLHTRGKRVTAEAVIPRELMEKHMHVSTETAFGMRGVSNLGSFMAGANNNGSHSANGITALFIAAGQDAANLAESSSALVYAELTAEKDYYYSITIPSLIVATYGGGTGLATQKECLEIMGCYGKDMVHKFAEIVAATVLCGEFSLGTAVISGEWVTSHEELGRNRS